MWKADSGILLWVWSKSLWRCSRRMPLRTTRSNFSRRQPSMASFTTRMWWSYLELLHWQTQWVAWSTWSFLAVRKSLLSGHDSPGIAGPWWSEEVLDQELQTSVRCMAIASSQAGLALAWPFFISYLTVQQLWYVSTNSIHNHILCTSIVAWLLDICLLQPW